RLRTLLIVCGGVFFRADCYDGRSLGTTSAGGRERRGDRCHRRDRIRGVEASRGQLVSPSLPRGRARLWYRVQADRLPRLRARAPRGSAAGLSAQADVGVAHRGQDGQQSAWALWSAQNMVASQVGRRPQHPLFGHHGPALCVGQGGGQPPARGPTPHGGGPSYPRTARPHRTGALGGHHSSSKTFSDACGARV
ncbi:hypothetical protein B484DRAFT_470498, partial [Ochromonadaceae sp. CCMP2298]